MKLHFYQTFAYLADEHPAAWPAPPSACDTDRVFGTDLPINNPVRIAEEYAQLDVLTGGKLRVGLLRGTPNEYLTYFDNPWESRERLEEGALLIKAWWTEPEPFGWEGRYYRFRNVAVWPRVIQDPHPPILISGNSPDGAVLTGRHGFDLGFSYMDPTRCLQHLELSHQTAAEHGWQRTSDNIQYRHWVWVDETDEKAQTANAHYVGAGFFALFSGASHDVMKAIGTCGAAGAGVGRGVRDESGLTFPDGPPSMPPPPMVPGASFVGNPDTVLAQIAPLRPSSAPAAWPTGSSSSPHPSTISTGSLAPSTRSGPRSKWSAGTRTVRLRGSDHRAPHRALRLAGAGRPHRQLGRHPRWLQQPHRRRLDVRSARGAP